MIPLEILKTFKQKNVLITGGTGMIGRQVSALMTAAGARVKLVSLDKTSAVPGAEHIPGDLSDFNFCKSVTNDMDYVFHTAGIKGSPDMTVKMPASFFVPLLMMNTNLLEACRVNRVFRILYTSSIGAYAEAEVFKESDIGQERPPMDQYPGWAKRMAEFQIRAYGIQYGLDNFSIVRLCNVYGPGDNFDPKNAMVIPSLMARVAQGENPLRVWGDGSAVRDFAYSEDIAEGIVRAIHFGTQGGFVNLGSGQGVSIRELIETLRQVTPFEFAFDTAASGRGFSRRVMDVTKARELLGYEPLTPLRRGLEKTWDWFQAHRDEHLKKMNYFVSEKETHAHSERR